MPGRHAEFKIKRLNRQSATAKGWIKFQNWKACAKPVPLEWLRPFPCWAGLDLANNTDLCSLRLLWKVQGIYYTWGRRWVPELAVKQRTQRGTVPYAAWVQMGALEQTPGEINDHGTIEQAIKEARARFRITTLFYDGWNAAQLVAKVKAAGMNVKQFIQGPKSYHPAMQEFERAYLVGNLHHAGDPVLTFCAANLVVRRDVNLNMAPDRTRSADKIDDMVALLMAFGGTVVDEGPRSVGEVVAV